MRGGGLVSGDVFGGILLCRVILIPKGRRGQEIEFEQFPVWAAKSVYAFGIGAMDSGAVTGTA